MRSSWILAGLVLVSAVSVIPGQQTIRLHSGLVSSIRHVPEPPGGFSAPLTQAELRAARNGPPPVAIIPDPAWSSDLVDGADPTESLLGLDDFLRLAGWISNASDPAAQRSAIYAVDFNVREPVITSAELVITTLVDDTLGDFARGNSFFLNWQRYDSGASSFTRTAQRVIDVTGVLQAGPNVLYLPVINVGGPSGLCFGAEIRVNLPARRDVESIVLRSGVSDTSVTHHAWPVPDTGIPLSEFSTPSSAIFGLARSGPVTPLVPVGSRPPEWAGDLNNPALRTLPGWAQGSSWISENANGVAGNSALYAIPFQVNSTVIESAILDLYCAADETLGVVGSNAVFVNGVPLTAGIFGKQRAASRLFNPDVGPLLVPGLNWLYLNVTDWGGGSGINFAARVLVNGRPGRADPGVAVFGTVDYDILTSGVQGVNCQAGLGPPEQPIAAPINPANLAVARNGEVYALSPAQVPPVWTPSLAIPAGFGPDNVTWMSSAADPLQADSAFYAFEFEIEAETVESAQLTVYFAVDDTLSSVNGAGFWLNGNPLANSAFGNFSSTHVYTADVSTRVGPGTNWFYVETSDTGLHEGIILSAEVRVNGGRASASGSAVAAINDITGDGIRDLVIGNGGVGVGTGRPVEEVQFVDGADGSLLFLVTDPAGGAPSEFGFSATAISDHDGDGVRDVAVGAPGHDAERGRVYILSGRTASMLLALEGSAAGDRYGHAIDVVGDLDGDGQEELVVGAPGADAFGIDSGSAQLYRGGPVQQLSLLAARVGPGAGARMGTSLSGFEDFNANGARDIAIGAPGRDRVQIYSGAAMTLVAEIDGDAPGSNFGAAVALSQDVNGDGRNDLVVGAPRALGGRGAVFIYTGGPTPAQCFFEQYGNDDSRPLGDRVHAVGDVDGNGLGEIAFAQVNASTSCAGVDLAFIFLEGTDSLFGSDGELRILLTSDKQDSTTTRGADLNGDGRNELIVTSWNLSGASCSIQPGTVTRFARSALPSSFQVLPNPLSGSPVRIPAPPGVRATTEDASRVIVSWSPLNAVSLDRYEILRDGVLMGSVPRGGAPQFEDSPPQGAYAYTVRSVAIGGLAGNESAPVIGVRPFLGGAAARGNVGGTAAEAIVTIDGSTGGPLLAVELAINQAGTLVLGSPSTTGPVPYILFAEFGIPAPGDAFVLPLSFGQMVFPPYTLDPGRGGLVIANSLFPDPVALYPSGLTPFQATVSWFAPLEVTFQAVVLTAPGRLEVTNAIALRIR